MKKHLQRWNQLFFAGLVGLSLPLSAYAYKIEELYCPLVTPNPYGEISVATDELLKSVSSTACQSGQNAAEISTRFNQLQQAVKKMGIYEDSARLEHQNSVDADGQAVVTSAEVDAKGFEADLNVLTQSIDGVIKLLDNADFLNSSCGRFVSKDKNFILHLTDVVSSVAPYTLVALANPKFKSVSAAAPIVLSVIGSATLLKYFAGQSSQNLDINIETERKLIEKNTCLYVNLRKRFSQLTLIRQSDEETVKESIRLAIIDLEKMIDDQKTKLGKFSPPEQASIRGLLEAKTLQAGLARDKIEIEQIREDLGLTQGYFGGGRSRLPGRGVITRPGFDPSKPGNGNGGNANGPFPLGDKGRFPFQINHQANETIDNLTLQDIKVPSSQSSAATSFAAANRYSVVLTDSKNTRNLMFRLNEVNTGGSRFSGVSRFFRGNTGTLSETDICTYVGKELVSADRKASNKFPYALMSRYESVLSFIPEHRQKLLKAHVSSFDNIVNSITAADLSRPNTDSQCAQDTHNLIGHLEMVAGASERILEKVLKAFQFQLSLVSGYEKWAKELDTLLVKRAMKIQELNIVALLQDNQGIIEVSDTHLKIDLLDQVMLSGASSGSLRELLGHNAWELFNVTPPVYVWLTFKLNTMDEFISKFEKAYDGLNALAGPRQGVFGALWDGAWNLVNEYTPGDMSRDAESNISSILSSIDEISNHDKKTRKTQALCKGLSNAAEQYVMARDQVRAANIMCETLDEFLIEDGKVDPELLKVCKHTEDLNSQVKSSVGFAKYNNSGEMLPLVQIYSNKLESEGVNSRYRAIKIALDKLQCHKQIKFNTGVEIL